MLRMLLLMVKGFLWQKWKPLRQKWKLLRRLATADSTILMTNLTTTWAVREARAPRLIGLLVGLFVGFHVTLLVDLHVCFLVGLPVYLC